MSTRETVCHRCARRVGAGHDEGGAQHNHEMRLQALLRLLLTALIGLVAWFLTTRQKRLYLESSDLEESSTLAFLSSLLPSQVSEADDGDTIPAPLLSNNTQEHQHAEEKEYLQQQEEQPKLLGLIYPPGLMGGYRNQVIRFMGLVHYAMQHNFTQLYLPSLLWTSTVNVNGASRNLPVPMEWIFDVGYWNQMAQESRLPQIVDLNLTQSDCWSTWEDQELLLQQYLGDQRHPLIRAALSRGGWKQLQKYELVVASMLLFQSRTLE